jgi:hypothetical protein
MTGWFRLGCAARTERVLKNVWLSRRQADRVIRDINYWWPQCQQQPGRASCPSNATESRSSIDIEPSPCGLSLRRTRHVHSARAPNEEWSSTSTSVSERRYRSLRRRNADPGLVSKGWKNKSTPDPGTSPSTRNVFDGRPSGSPGPSISGTLPLVEPFPERCPVGARFHKIKKTA